MKYCLIALFIFIATPVWACSCVAPTMEQGALSFNKSDVIVKGIVTEDSMGWGGRKPMIKLTVEDVIKGKNIPEEITIDYNANTAACGNDFTVNEKYVLALYDTRALTLSDDNKRGYGFRVMVSCHQMQIRNYIEHKAILKRQDAKTSRSEI